MAMAEALSSLSSLSLSHCPCRLLRSRENRMPRVALPAVRGARAALSPRESSRSAGLVRKKISRSVSAAALPSEALDLLPFAVTGTSALAFVSARAVVYFRMQYVIAAMLGRHVPRGGARVVDLNIGPGRNLYYLPNDVVQVLAVNPAENKQLLENQAIQARIPIEIRTRDLLSLQLPAASYDAVVSVYGFSQLEQSTLPLILNETSRILKAGKPLIFVESSRANGGPLKAIQGLWWDILKATGRKTHYRGDLLEAIKATPGFEDVSADRLLEFQDPHVVGVAIKGEVSAGKKVKASSGGFKGFSSKGESSRK